ncbi:MAG TPA: hypothetical protein VF092_07070 [Longimicrobium sp.]
MLRIRAFFFFALLVSLAAIDSVAAVVVHEHPDRSPSALMARAAVSAIGAYSSAERVADAGILPILALFAAFFSLAISDAVILFSGVRLDPGFVGAGPFITRLAVPAAASAAGAILALALQSRRA